VADFFVARLLALSVGRLFFFVATFAGFFVAFLLALFIAFK
jgi:hypothetical protein